MKTCVICGTAHGAMVHQNISYDKDGCVMPVYEVCPHCRKSSNKCSCTDEGLWRWLKQWWEDEPSEAVKLASQRVHEYIRRRRIDNA